MGKKNRVKKRDKVTPTVTRQEAVDYYKQTAEDIISVLKYMTAYAKMPGLPDDLKLLIKGITVNVNDLGKTLFGLSSKYKLTEDVTVLTGNGVDDTDWLMVMVEIGQVGGTLVDTIQGEMLALHAKIGEFIAKEKDNGK